MKNHVCCAIVVDLVGKRLPNFSLPSTHKGDVLLSETGGDVVLVIYPYTGRPDFPDPENWDNIKGAHGSTPQLLAYSMLYEEFHKRNVKVFGLSQLSPEWQQEFANRNKLSFALLSDRNFTFSSALRLERFETGGTTFLSRCTLIINEGIVTHARNKIASPESDADEVLKVLA